MGKQQGWEMKIQGGRWRERERKAREGPCGGGVETEVSCLRRRLAEGGGAAGKISQLRDCVMCVCQGRRGTMVWVYVRQERWGQSAAGKVRKGERERNMVKAIKPPKGSSRVLRNTFLAVS